MPYLWNDTAREAPYIEPQDADTDPDAPLATLRLWPHRSLPPKGFVATILGLFALSLLPTVALLGSKMLWVVLGFTLVALAGLWVALRRSYDAGLGEEVTFCATRVCLTRTDPRQSARHWQANPYWISLDIRPTGGPVEQYLTLKGEGRTVELGAFLSPEERLKLRDDLAFVLGQINDAAQRP